MKSKVSYVVVGLLLIFVMGAALSTKVAKYETLVISAAGAETQLLTGATTAFNPGVPSPGVNLNPVDIKALWSDKESSTSANGVVLTCYATASANDTCEMEIYGIADGGAPERICDVVWTFGTARHTSTTILWADTCTLTDDNHISGCTVSDDADNAIVKLSFDTTGYRYLYAVAYGTASGTATNITVKMRPY